MKASEQYDHISKGGKKPAKKIKHMHVSATDNGKHIVTHEHHHSQHHPNETHAMDNIEALQKHMADNAPNITPQAPPVAEQGMEPGSAGEMSAGAASPGPTGM